MKKVLVTLAVCIAILTMAAAPVFAAAQKVDLIPCPLNYPDPDALPPGRCFVIFNNSSGPRHNLEVTVSMKGVEPDTAYDIYLFVDGWWYLNEKAGTIITNKRGNANLHINVLVSQGEHILAVDITKAGSYYDIYETPEINHSGEPVGGTVMIFN